MTAVTYSMPRFQAIDDRGRPMVGAKLYTYENKSMTPAATWMDADQAAANTNPIELDARGEAVVWLANTERYTFELRDRSGSLVWSQDNVSGVASAPNFEQYKSDLADTSFPGGAALIGRNAIAVDSVADLLALPEAARRADLHYLVRCFHAGTDVGGGGFYYDPSRVGESDGGTVLDGFVREIDGFITPSMFGAACDGETPDHAVINEAALACRSKGLPLYGDQGKEYLLEGTVNLNCPSFLSGSTFVVDADSAATGVVVGPTDSGILSRAIIELPLIRAKSFPDGNWGGRGVGLELANAYECQILIPSVSGFEVGVTSGGYGRGFVYNTVTIGRIRDNKINLRVKPGNSTGWANDNIFISGRFGHSNDAFSDWSETRDILIQNEPIERGGPPNNNLFIKPMLEGSQSEYRIDLQGYNNTFINPRFEGSGVKKIRLFAPAGSVTSENIFLGGLGILTVVFEEEGDGDVLYNRISGSRKNVYYAQASNSYVSSGVGVDHPHQQGFISNASVSGGVLNASRNSPEWVWRTHGNGLSFKGFTDSVPRLNVRRDGVIEFGDGDNPPDAALRRYAANNLSADSNFIPYTDDDKSLGITSRRWSQVYSSNGSINTSDEREKQNITTLSESETAVALEIKGLLKKYKWKSALEEKGDQARWHFGAMAQDVQRAFAKHGLDAHEYGVFCYDEWEEQQEVMDEKTGETITPYRPAGDRFGVRYNELLAFILAAL